MPTAFNASLYSVLRALHVPDHDAYDAATHQVAEVPQRDPARVLDTLDTNKMTDLDSKLAGIEAGVTEVRRGQGRSSMAADTRDANRTRQIVWLTCVSLGAAGGLFIALHAMPPLDPRVTMALDTLGRTATAFSERRAAGPPVAYAVPRAFEPAPMLPQARLADPLPMLARPSPSVPMPRTEPPAALSLPEQTALPQAHTHLPAHRGERSRYERT
jgi:hypothetical protein